MSIRAPGPAGHGHPSGFRYRRWLRDQQTWADFVERSQVAYERLVDRLAAAQAAPLDQTCAMSSGWHEDPAALIAEWSDDPRSEDLADRIADAPRDHLMAFAEALTADQVQAC